ncbi:MAG: hypothetical protein H7141_05345 [Burkholderiales bacterium]|nr:hypothetical protein [Bacteroidia bacterium]
MKPEPNYSFNVYGYADLVREYGLGFQCQIFPSYNLDVAAYLINPNTFFKDKIRQWDYYDLKGYGFSFKPKYQFSKLSRVYAGFNISYEKLYHDKVWVDYSYSDDFVLYALEEAKGSAYNIGITFGTRLTYKRILIEPFWGLGYATANIVATTFEVRGPNVNPNYNYNQSYKPKHDYFQFNIGLKFGLSFKKSKKHNAIDKRFDEVYIPKSNSLKTYFKSINFKDHTVKKDTRRAYARYEGLNRNTLCKYRRYYRDTTKFYSAVDFLFNRIDSLIVKGNK